MRKPDSIEWKHTATYIIDPEVDAHLVAHQVTNKDGDYVMGTLTSVVVTWYDPSGLEEGDDNDALISFYAKPLTNKGKPDRRSRQQGVYFSDREDRLICEALGIDLTCPVDMG